MTEVPGALLRDRLRGSRRPVIGRDELAASLACLPERAAPLVAYVHGIAGIGKSSLLCEVAARARGRGTSVIELDGGAIEPTDSGFLDALGRAAGLHLSSAEALSLDLSRAGPLLLVIDTYERLRLLDTWVRRVLLPALPANARVVIGGREPPSPPWLYEREWRGLFESIPLGPLDERAALALLAAEDVPPAAAARVNLIARGHPLALTLAAATLRHNALASLEEAASLGLVQALAGVYLDEIVDMPTREAVRAASVTRRSTESLLAAQLPGIDAAVALQSLSALPFVEAHGDGLSLHDAVRQAVAAQLRTLDPLRHRELKRAAWRQLQAEVRGAGETDLWRYTADILYLLDNPVLREGFFPSTSPPLALEPALPADHEVIRATYRRHDGPEAAALLDAWLEHKPEAFSVVRDRSGGITGFRCSTISDEVSDALAAADPIVRSWLDDLHAATPQDRPAFFLRRWLSCEEGEGPSDTQGVLWIDCKRSYLKLRPHLGSVYVSMRTDVYDAPLHDLGFRQLPSAGATVDGQVYYSLATRFGEGSVDGWLARLVARELGVDPGGLLDEQARQLVLNGQRIPLTPLEFAVLRYLTERRGRAVSHADLVADVWGYGYTGESNVVAVVIRALRAKLGAGASLIETVRGVGYRLRE